MTLLFQELSPSKHCGGFHSCEDRSFDDTQPDCQECLADSESAMQESQEDTS